MPASSLAARGSILELAYPAHNLIGIPLEYTRRIVEVIECRSFAETPILFRAFRKRPYLRRGIVLVTGIDLQLGRKRCFYLEAQHRRRLPAFRIGVFDPAAPYDSVDWLTDPYPPTIPARQKMLRDFEKLEELDFAHLQVGAFPVKS